MRRKRITSVKGFDYEKEHTSLHGIVAVYRYNGDWMRRTHGQSDALDQVSANVCTIGMIYAFYGRLSVASTDVEKFRASKIPPIFFAYGTSDPFYSQFQACADAVREAGVEVEEHEYEGMPHGFGYTHEEWMVSFDSWMSKIMANN